MRGRGRIQGPPLRTGYKIGVDFSTGPGTYGLVYYRPRDGLKEVGKLGRFTFPAGFYLYVGSALGPGGLAGRLRRHLSQDKRVHWHVDYLGEQAQAVEIWLTQGEERLEHVWAASAGQLPGASAPVAGFGASDCRCPAHLYHFGERPDSNRFQLGLEEQGAGARPVRVMLIVA
jgi:Uri superfamily endonuclease